MRQANLFLADNSFQQSQTLRFLQKSSENKYFKETLFKESSSINSLWIFFILAWASLTLFTLSPIPYFLTTFTLISCKYTSIIIPNRILFQVYLYCWEISSIKSGSIIELIGAFLPSLFLNFYLSKTWIHLATYLGLNVILAHFYFNLPLLNLILSVFVVLLIAFVLEKDSRDLWHLYSSYKKSHHIHRNLWNLSPFVNIMIDSQFNVIIRNKTAENSYFLTSTAAKDSKDRIKFALSPDFLDKCKPIIENTLKGTINEDEIFTSRVSTLSKDSINNLYMLIFTSIVAYGSSNCTRMICIDASHIRATKLIIINCLNEVESIIPTFFQSFYDLFINESTVSEELLRSFSKINQAVRNAIIIKSRFYGRFDQKNEHFDVHSEIINSIELLYPKASSYNVKLIYTKEKGIPPSLIGDKDLCNQIILSILNLVLNKAASGSEVSIFLQITVSNIQSLVKYDIRLNFKFTFQSTEMTNLDVSAIFPSQSYICNHEYVENIAEYLNTYGFGLAATNIILFYLSGSILKLHSENNYKKVSINLTLPFFIGKKEIPANILHLTKAVVQENGLTTQWIPPLNSLTSDTELLSKFKERKSIEVHKKNLIMSKNHSELGLEDTNKPKIINEKTKTMNGIIKISNVKNDKSDIIRSVRNGNMRKFIGNNLLVVLDNKYESVLFEKWQDYFVKICVGLQQGIKIFDRFFEYSAKFSLVYIWLNEENTQNLISHIRNKEQSSLYNSLIIIHPSSFQASNTNNSNDLISNSNIVTPPVSQSAFLSLLNSADTYSS